ncbi:CwfJ C-terminus 1-domain-containing protein-like protein [Lipomyces oligophaga]|uniref:CwfJ C-terminus 1-domain-containing protein-like protein n=1 Tax=Lipomyces oligophaga TaxID=45792 RepID=UPI0034CFB3AC
MSIIKILVFGSPNKNFITGVTKAGQINVSAGPFDALLLLGNAFDSDSRESDIDDVLSGKIELPIPTYFYYTKLLPPKIVKAIESSQNGLIAKNLRCVGDSSIVKTSNGATISFSGPECSIFDIERLKAQKAVDVMVSDHWPAHIDLLSSSIDEMISSAPKDSKISDLAALLQPRYHFSPGQIFWEREPYRNQGYLTVEGGGERPTRFISLAELGNSYKSKWFYAFNISVPYISVPLPSNTTENPYIEGARATAAEQQANKRSSQRSTDEELLFGNGMKRKRQNAEDQSNEDKILGKFDGKSGQVRKRGNNRVFRSHMKAVDPSSCFFCLSNSQLAQHFIVAIGDESYIATAKGPLPSPTSERLDCPGHIIIIPFAHQPTLISIEDESSRTQTKLEMDKFRARVSELYLEQGYHPVAFDIQKSSNIHFHIQMVPVPNAKISLVEEAFFQAAETNGMKFVDESSLEQDFFRLYLPNKTLYMPLDSSKRFDLQFGRKVLASVLELPDRVDWRNCVQDEADEERDAERFKQLFAKYDFTNDESNLV